MQAGTPMPLLGRHLAAPLCMASLEEPCPSHLCLT